MAHDIEIPLKSATLAGILTVVPEPAGIVVFAHGSGSSRHSPRNQYVAEVLNEAGLATLLFDLLTSHEEADRRNVFDIPMLGDRLGEVTEWLATVQSVADLAVGYFGASTGAGAALWAAASSERPISAVVSRGGRPDLAEERLAQVESPTLLIVGSRDPVVVDLNRKAQALLRCESRLTIVPGATHLFEEPGALEKVAEHARDWFLDHI